MSMRTTVSLVFATLLIAAIPALAQAPADPAQTLTAANSLFDREQWGDAVTRYEQFIAAAPQDDALPFALFRAGECYYNLAKYEKAQALYQRLVSDFAKHEIAPDAQYRLGDAQLKLGKPEEALKAYQALLESAPSGPLAYRAAYWQGEALYRLARYPEAIAAYEQSLKLSPEGNYAAYAGYSIALCQSKLTQYPATIERLEGLLQKFPKHDLVPEMTFRLGEARYATKDYPAAIAQYQKVIADPAGARLAPLAQSGLAWSLWNQEKYAEALVAFRGLQKSADPVLAREGALRAADCLYLLQKYDEAATAYGAIVAAKSEASPGALFWQAMALEHKPDKAAALKAFAQFIKDNPKHERVAEATLHLGALQIEAGQLAAAEASYKAAEAQTQDPELKLQAHYGAAWAAYQRAPSNEALQAIEVLAEQAPQSALAAQVAYQTGKLRFNRGDYARALVLLALLVQNHPDDAHAAEAVYLTGASHEKLNDPAQAEAAYNRVLERYPQSEAGADALVALVAMNARTGQLDAARGALDRLAQRPDAARALPAAQYALAEALFAAQKYPEAAPLYEAVAGAKTSPLAPYAAYGLGAARFAQGDHEGAATAFRGTVTDFPKADTLAPAQYQLALTLGKLGKPQEELKLLDELFAANPKGKLVDAVLLEMGWVRMEQKQLPQAAAAFDRLLALTPPSPHAAEATFRLGDVRYEQGDFAAAQKAYEQVLAKYATSSVADEAEYKLGWALLKQAKPEAALPHFEKAATTADAATVATDARYQAAVLHVTAGRYDQAVALLAPVQESAPAALAPRVLLLLAQSHLALKDTAQAAPLFEALGTRYPDDALAPQALVGLGRCQKAERKYEAAAATFTKATQSADARAALEARFELAETRRLQDDPRAAATEYLKVVAATTEAEWGARAQYAAGVCYEQAQAREDAVKAYKVVLERYKDQAEWVKKAQERLQVLQ